MDSLINAFLAIGLLVLILLVVYLVDRVNSLEKETLRISQMASPAMSAPADPWLGLSGKALWDAVSGRPPASLSVAALEELRVRYELVLHKHIQSLFDEGARDGRRGLSGEPKNPRMLQTAQGPVESWMPTAQVNTLYKCGLDSSQMAPEALGPVRQAIDEAGKQLFAKVQLPLTEPLSASLLPAPPVPVTAPAPTAEAPPAPDTRA